MRRTTLSLLILSSCICSSITAQPQTTQDIAKVNHVLSDYRDISFFFSPKPGLARFTPDSQRVAVIGKSGNIVIYDVESGEIKSRIARSPAAFSFSRDSRFAVIQEENGLAPTVFETDSGKLVRDPNQPNVSSQLQEQIDVRDKSIGINISKISFVEILRIPISPDGKYILGGSNGSEFTLYDFQRAEIHKELKHESFSKFKFIVKSILLPLPQFTSYSFSLDGKFIAIANGNNSPTIWETVSGKLVAKLAGSSSIYLAAFNPNSRVVATTTLKGGTQLFSVENGLATCTIDPKKTRGQFSLWNVTGDKFLVLQFSKGDLLAFDSATCKLLYSFEGSNASAAIPNNDGKLIATLPRKNKRVLFQIWELETGRLISTIPRESGRGEVQSLRWSPDDKLLLSASSLNHEIDLWSVEGRHLQKLKNSRFPMQFSPDSKKIVTGGKSENGKTDAAYIWKLTDR